MIREWLRSQFELTRGEASTNMRPMEGLRGFAVFLVFLVHYVTLIEPWMNDASALFSIARMLHAMGNTGVDLFFVLSGYLIYGSLIVREQSFFSFIRRRIQRIYPAFSVVFVAYVALSWLFPAESKIPADLFDAVSYLGQNFLLLPGLMPVQPLITVAWSLSYEMFYYIALPVLINLLGLRQRSVHWRVGFFSVLALVIAVISARYGGPARLLMFVSGILLYDVISHRLLHAPGSIVASLALLAGLISSNFPVHGASGIVFKTLCPFVAFFIVCHTCFSRPSSAFAHAFGFTGLRWLGNMSYSYYLVHGLALKAACLLLGKLLPSSAQGNGFFVVMMVGMFIGTLIPATITFVVIERPFSLYPRKMRVHGKENADKAIEQYAPISRTASTARADS
jgi:exopolysaccharide production protein ExoZ